jgi:hypothetical protein
MADLGILMEDIADSWIQVTAIKLEAFRSNTCPGLIYHIQ